MHYVKTDHVLLVYSRRFWFTFQAPSNVLWWQSRFCVESSSKQRPSSSRLIIRYGSREMTLHNLRLIVPNVCSRLNWRWTFFSRLAKRPYCAQMRATIMRRSNSATFSTTRNRINHAATRGQNVGFETSFRSKLSRELMHLYSAQHLWTVKRSQKPVSDLDALFR